ncbi:MAG: hypothetical protein KDI82_06070 [Gammaproteobacteria bacterium]|nr:hypothetical protein [Gammaproteobacteria bacterium]
MKTEKRGSEKLMQGCTSLNTLSREELEQVAGGALLGGGTSIYWKQFPHGIPWPEIFKVNVLREIDQGVVQGIDQQLGRGF